MPRQVIDSESFAPPKHPHKSKNILMTLQQLRYIIAVDRYRNFAKAADSCRVSQPTLSAMLVKLEEELDVRIFERTNKSVTPTEAGIMIIRQAERVLNATARIGELVNDEKGKIGGRLDMAVSHHRTLHPSTLHPSLPGAVFHCGTAYPGNEIGRCD